MKLLKGVTVSIFLFLLCIVAPFNIHAAGETQIIPTWSQSSQQTEWSSKFRVTNFCESSNNPQNYSCQLTITVKGDYYGYVYFDGYINNQIIWNYQTMFISGGKGTFYYTWYANGLQQINKVNIAGLSLVSPTDNINLDQIIDLLTSINSYNQQSVGNQSTQIQQLQTVINDLIISNGYLETISKLRQYNFPIESFSAIYPYFLRNYELVDIGNNSYYQYPIFKLNAGDTLLVSQIWKDRTADFYFYIDKDLYPANLDQYFQINQGEMTVTNMPSYTFNSIGWGYVTYNHIHVVNNTGANNRFEITAKQTVNIIPIFSYRHESYKVSTDFALLYGFSNQLLDDLHIIANGTTQSNQQSSDLSSGTDSMQQQMNSFTVQEDSYNDQMNNSINAIDFTSPVSQNAGILPAANFVISIFNGLIQNNAFSVLILIVCVLIIGKKVIGK